MLITSLTFLFFFLPTVTIIHYFVKDNRKNIFLLIFNVVFYIWVNPLNIIFIFISSILFYTSGLLMSSGNIKIRKKRKLIFIIVIVLNVFLLMIFKYTGFFINIINSISTSSFSAPKLPFPLGISFFIFQGISYVSDIYTGKMKKSPVFLDFLAYITMFPTITSGPIVRYLDIKDSLESRTVTASDINISITKIIYGLAKKVLIANNIYGLWLTSKQMDLGEITVFHSWFMALAYMMFIYFDFSGYSDMAIGIGRLLGFDFKENFNYPYTSKNISEFFRRWHISLGSWFRDYIYIPLGGSRSGSFRTILNILIVWAVTGLWHGPSWNFVVWGLYFGVIVIIEKFVLSRITFTVPALLKHIYTLFFIIIGWVLFFSTSFSELLTRLKIMMGIGGNQLYNEEFFYYFGSYFFIIIIAIFFSIRLPKNLIMKFKINYKIISLIVLPAFKAILLILSVAYLLDATHTPFLYANF